MAASQQLTSPNSSCSRRWIARSAGRVRRPSPGCRGVIERLKSPPITRPPSPEWSAIMSRIWFTAFW